MSSSPSLTKLRSLMLVAIITRPQSSCEMICSIKSRPLHSITSEGIEQNWQWGGWKVQLTHGLGETDSAFLSPPKGPSTKTWDNTGLLPCLNLHTPSGHYTAAVLKTTSFQVSWILYHLQKLHSIHAFDKTESIMSSEDTRTPAWNVCSFHVELICTTSTKRRRV